MNIADVVSALVIAGCSPEQISKAVEVLSPKRTSGASRQARYRERKASQTVTNVTESVTERNVTHAPLFPLNPPDKETSPTPPKENNPPISPNTPLAPQAAEKRNVGSRLSVDWVLPLAWGRWALDEVQGVTVDVIRSQADQFKDYWISKAGAGARKTDWEATWRNWMRNAAIRQPRGSPQKLTRMDELRSNLRERIENGSASQGSDDTEPVRRISFLRPAG